jgi:outer membrane lipoprotein LolB
LKRRQLLGLILPLGGMLAGGLLGGCAGHASSTAGIGPPVDRFSVAGRLSLRQGQRRDHLRFDWRHSAQGDALLLSTPIGQGLAEILRDAAGARLIRPGEATVEATDLAALAQQVFGMPLPLQELAEWLRGARGVRGAVAGWSIGVVDAVTRGEGTAVRRLPRRIDASRDDVELTLVIEDWEGS